MKLCLLPNNFSVCRLSPTESLPIWATEGSFFSITKTDDELSVVCNQRNVPDSVKAEGGWRALQVEGPLDFALTGILASIAKPLADAKVSLFAISTFDTDYVLVKEQTLERATHALRAAGFTID